MQNSADFYRDTVCIYIWPADFDLPIKVFLIDFWAELRLYAERPTTSQLWVKYERRRRLSVLSMSKLRYHVTPSAEDQRCRLLSLSRSLFLSPSLLPSRLTAPPPQFVNCPLATPTHLYSSPNDAIRRRLSFTHIYWLTEPINVRSLRLICKSVSESTTRSKWLTP